MFSDFIETSPNRIACEFSGGAGAWVPAGGVAGSREPGVWLSETGVAFACSCPCGVETLVAFARVGRASTETGVAFAGEKWVFFVRFSAAEVLSVSVVAVEGRAVVMAVSRWPAVAVAEVSLVSMSPRGCVLWANKFAQRTKMDRNRRFMARWASFFADRPPEAALMGELFCRHHGTHSRPRCWRGCVA